MSLYEFERDAQLKLIASHPQRYGRLTGRMEGAFGEIFTFERNAYPRHIVAKCPKVERFGSNARAREALGKTVMELEKTLRSCRHPGVHRISGLELVHGWPFLVSRLRKGTLADLIADPTQWTLTSKLMSFLQVARTLNYCRRVGLIAHQDLKPDNIFFDLPKEKICNRFQELRRHGSRNVRCRLRNRRCFSGHWQELWKLPLHGARAAYQGATRRWVKD